MTTKKHAQQQPEEQDEEMDLDLRVGDRIKVGRFGPVWVVVRSEGPLGFVQREDHSRKWFGYSFNRETGEIAVYPIVQGTGERKGDVIAFGPAILVEEEVEDSKSPRKASIGLEDDGEVSGQQPHVVFPDTTDTNKNDYFAELWPQYLADEAINVPARLPAQKSNPSTTIRRAQIVDEAKFVNKVADILVAHVDSIEWTEDRLNGGATERAVVTRAELARWLSGDGTGSPSAETEGGAAPEATQYIIAAAGDERGLRLIGDAFVAAGIADFTRLGFASGEPTLVVYRETE